MSDASKRRDHGALFVDYRRTRDRALRNRIIEMNLGLAEHLAYRYSGRGERQEDLSQVAMVGLLKAVERFEPERGLAFSSFATPTIEGELKRHFRDQRWAVRVPRRLQELSLEVNQAIAILSQQLGRAPTVAELARVVRASDEEVLEALEAGRASTASSLDAPSGDDDRGGLIDSLPGDERGAEAVEDREVIAGLLAVLAPREQEIVTLRFYGSLTQTQIAERFGISQMQVSRLIARSLSQMRAELK